MQSLKRTCTRSIYVVYYNNNNNNNLYSKLRTIIREFVQYYVTLQCCTYRAGWFRHRSLTSAAVARFVPCGRQYRSARVRPPSLQHVAVAATLRNGCGSTAVGGLDDSGVVQRGCVATGRKSVNGRRGAGMGRVVSVRPRAHPELGTFIRRRRQ